MFAEQIKTISRRKHFTLKQQKQGQKYTYEEPKKMVGRTKHDLSHTNWNNILVHAKQNFKKYGRKV
jgi:hypothetical protein